MGTLRIVHCLRIPLVNEPELPAAAAPATSRVSFERLRERTDELELIISGLSLFALLSLPGWLFEQFQVYYARLPIGITAAAVGMLPITSAICYVMALLFLLHLAVRAHWIGLVGLKSAFPLGVRWERLRGVGPVTQQALQRRLGSVDDAIVRADRIASVLFSLITFSAISLGVLGAWMTLTFVVGGLFGSSLGGTNHFINEAIGWLVLAMIGVPLLLWLLDGVIARRWRWLREARLFALLVAVLRFVEGLFFPPRLVGAARLTLQSNTLPRLFFPLFIVALLAVSQFGTQLFQQGRGFDVMGSQVYVAGRDIQAGQRSLFYETQRTPIDRIRTGPIIPSPVIETAWLPLFLPYTAIIDDPVLAQRCPPERGQRVPPVFLAGADDTDAEAMAREAEQDRHAHAAADCLKTVWEVRIDGRTVPLDGFLPAERLDLGLRGLSGYLPLNGLVAGPHRLDIIWRPQPERDDIAEDYVPRRVRYVIPFLWSPEAAAAPSHGETAG